MVWRPLKQLFVFSILTLIALSITFTPSPAQALVLSSPGVYTVTLYATFDNQSFTPINGTLYFYYNGTVKASFTLPKDLVGGYPVNVTQGDYYTFNTGGTCYWVYYYTMENGKPTRVNVTTYTWDANSNYIIFQAPITGTIYIAREQGSCSGTLDTADWFEPTGQPSAVEMNITFSAVWSDVNNTNASFIGYWGNNASYTSGSYTVGGYATYNYTQISTQFATANSIIDISVAANTTLDNFTLHARTEARNLGLMTGEVLNTLSEALEGLKYSPVNYTVSLSGSNASLSVGVSSTQNEVSTTVKDNNVILLYPQVYEETTYTVSSGVLTASNGNTIHVSDTRLEPSSSRLYLRAPYYLSNITSLVGEYSGSLRYVEGNTSLLVLSQNNTYLGGGYILAPHLYTWSFDGVDDYIGTGLTLDNFSITGNQSIETYAYILGMNGFAGLVFARNGYGSQTGIDPSYTESVMFPFQNDTANIDLRPSLNQITEGWHYLAMIYDNNTVTGYVDTTSQNSSATQSLFLTGSATWRVGYSGGFAPAVYLHAYVAYVRMYNRVLSNAEITDRHIVNSSELKLFLDPTFYNGTTYLDLSPYGNDGTPYGGVARVRANNTWLWVVENARSDSYIHLEWFPVDSKLYFYQNNELVKTVDVNSNNMTLSLLAGNYTVRAYIPAPFTYTPISLDKLNETVSLTLVGQAPMQPVGFDSNGSPLYKWAPTVSRGLHILNLSLGKWDMRLMADSPITLLGASDTEGYLEVETHNTTLYIYVGDTGKPSSVVIDNQPAIEGADWDYNTTGKYIWIHVPSSIVRIQWASSSSSESGGGGGGGIIGPAASNPPGNPNPSLPPVSTGINAKAVIGLLIIVGAVLGSSILGSYKSRGGKLHDKWTRRLERELNRKVEWKRKKKWWE